MRFLCLFFCLASCAFAEEIDLNLYEVSVYSQYGEDGVIAKIFDVIPPTSRYCVEFGAYDGITGSNTYLLRKQGWKSLLMDRMFEIPEYNLHKEFIMASNIESLFDQYGVPLDVDLISIDIDYNDFYIWQAITHRFQPKVVVIECNPTHGPSEDKVVKYRPFYCGDGTNYYGASVLALYHLGQSKGYSLVYQESSGTNLFFVRDDLLQKHGVAFKNCNNVAMLYRAPTYGSGPNGGHVKDLKQREYRSSLDLIKP